MEQKKKKIKIKNDRLQLAASSVARARYCCDPFDPDRNGSCSSSQTVAKAIGSNAQNAAGEARGGEGGGEGGGRFLNTTRCKFFFFLEGQNKILAYSIKPLPTPPLSLALLNQSCKFS